jgi:two-component system LytT family sensor kinase
LPNSILSEKRLRYFFSAWWFLWTLLQYIILRQLNVDYLHATIDSLVSNFLLAVCCLFISNNMKYYLPRREKYWYIMVISVSVSLLWMILLQAAVWMIFNKGDNYTEFIQSSWAIRFGAAFLLIMSMSMFSLLWYSQQEQKALDSRRTEAEQLSREAELSKLRQQLQPHFLFNSLNSISALTGSNPEKARHMIQQLSDFLRGTLRKNEQQWNTLEEELKYLELYLEIEKVRFGHRLQTEIKYESKNLSMKLPALLLQPVVENAIKFGLYDTTGEVIIRIVTTSEGGKLKITVQNPFDPETSQPFKGTGFGLSSIQRRLFLLFGRNDLLKTKKEEQHFITTILVPQSEELELSTEGKHEINDWIAKEINDRIIEKVNESMNKTKFK